MRLYFYVFAYLLQIITSFPLMMIDSCIFFVFVFCTLAFNRSYLTSSLLLIHFCLMYDCMSTHIDA